MIHFMIMKLSAQNQIGKPILLNIELKPLDLSNELEVITGSHRSKPETKLGAEGSSPCRLFLSQTVYMPHYQRRKYKDRNSTLGSNLLLDRSSLISYSWAKQEYRILVDIDLSHLRYSVKSSGKSWEISLLFLHDSFSSSRSLSN